MVAENREGRVAKLAGIGGKRGTKGVVCADGMGGDEQGVGIWWRSRAGENAVCKAGGEFKRSCAERMASPRATAPSFPLFLSPYRSPTLAWPRFPMRFRVTYTGKRGVGRQREREREGKKERETRTQIERKREGNRHGPRAKR